MSTKTLNRALLEVLGLTSESANLVMDEIERLEDAARKTDCALPVSHIRPYKAGDGPICWVCDGEIQLRKGKFICVSCDNAYRQLKEQMRLLEKHAGDMARDADAKVGRLAQEREELSISYAEAVDNMNRAKVKLAGAMAVVAAARESCSSTLIFLAGGATEDDHWRASQSVDMLRKALLEFDPL